MGSGVLCNNKHFVHRKLILCDTYSSHYYSTICLLYYIKNSMERKILMIKKITAMLAALTLSVCMLTSCNNSSSSDADSSSETSSSAADSSSSDASSNSSSSDSSGTSSSGDSSQVSEVTASDPSLTIDGKKQDIDDFVMCTIDGKDIDFTTFRYFYFYTLNQFAQNYGVTMDNIKSTKGAFEDLLKETVNTIKNNISIVDKLAKENGLELTEDDKKKAEEEYNSTKSSFKSEEEFQVQLKNSYMTDELFRNSLQYAQLKQKISNTLLTNDGKYATKKADFKNIVKDTSKYACEMHVMIPLYAEADLDAETAAKYSSMSLEEKVQAKQQAYSKLDDAGKEKAKEAAKIKADEALKKIQSGADFKTVMKDYGWDTALATNEAGYYFSKDNTSFPTELIQKTFTLKENEVAKDVLVHEMYGYFIVKRVAVDMKYVEEHIDALLQEYDTPLIQKTMTELCEKLDVKYCDGWDKLTPDSIS